MKQKWLLTTGAALMLAAAMAGCGSNKPAADQQQSSQQASYISMDEAQTAALNAAEIDAADANISAATLSEVAGVTCYRSSLRREITLIPTPSTLKRARCWR